MIYQSHPFNKMVVGVSEGLTEAYVLALMKDEVYQRVIKVDGVMLN